MKNLADKILNVLRNSMAADDVIADIKNRMSKLGKNLTHPLIDNEGKNKLLEAYMSLSDVEKLLYRYNVLIKNNQIAAANEKKDELENMVLNGHISKSNVKYVWRSEHGENTCEKCEDKDKNEYESDEDVPPQPHPNCKCYIEVVPVSFEKIEVEDTTDKKSDDKWIMPCEGEIVGYYGEVRPTHVHNGIDIAVPVGTPIKAVADGIIYYAGNNDPQGYGNYVIITHFIDGGTVTSEYGHLSSWNVKPGQNVKKGEIIAKSGNTGHSEGPHLHLTLRRGRYKGTPINPNQYIKY